MTALPAIRIEGGLFAPDLLDQVLAAELPGQRPADFGVQGRRTLTDEIAAAFAEARALWGVFQQRLERLPEGEVGTTVTRDAWVIPFLQGLGYELRYNQRAYEVDGQSFAVSHRAGIAEEAPPVHIVGARQELGRLPASGRPRLAPHSLVQEYLNRTEQVWGIVTNGLTLRLLRNSSFVRRQAYVEFDLRAILEDQRFLDFSALYRLLHRTRLPGSPPAGPCLLDEYYAHSIEQGGRVREHLRDGVEACIGALADGFLRHPATTNTELRARVTRGYAGHGAIPPEDFYRQLLKLIYRTLFLLVAEDRGLISPDPLYRDHYGIARLRRLVDRRAAYTEDDDLWQSLRVLWRVLSQEDLARELKVAPLNGALFAPVVLDSCTISNRDLLEALANLIYYHPDSASRRVNYAALDVEELGSIYESLLDFHPAIDPDGRGRPCFRLITGSERKTTGSYYTPPELAAELVRSALDPVLDGRLAAAPPEGQEAALLAIRVCDPACGSGHFLLAAARRMGRRLARIRTGEEEPAPERVREATRDVIGHCVYGVDKNPLAVDLCRVALWLESHTGNRPLTFLDHRIRPGDSLVGVYDLAALEDGIPDRAFKPLEGDDKVTARDLARRNKNERGRQRDLLAWQPAAALADFTRTSAEIERIRDDTPEDVRRKRQIYEARETEPAWQRRREACDLWTAAFFQTLEPGEPAITTNAVFDCMDGRPVAQQLQARAMELAHANKFFHWPLEFPEVFAQGGFDVMLSNPPWERVKLQEQEFFAVHDPRIAKAANKAERAKLIKALPRTNPALARLYATAQRSAGAVSAMLRHGGRFPLAARGDINTYAVFGELVAAAIQANGRAGLILPTGIATDDTTKVLFGALVRSGRLVDLIGFENEDHVFPAVHHSVTFCKLTVAGTAHPVPATRLAFRIRQFAQLAEAERYFTLRPEDFALLNPNTGTCPVFRSSADAELTKAIYRRVPILWREGGDDGPEQNPWRLSFKAMLHMANDSGLFRTAEQLEGEHFRLDGNVFVGAEGRYLPLYEAKMLHQFDHRASTYQGATQKQLNVGILPQPTPEQKADPAYAVMPRYWVAEAEVDARMPREPALLAAALRKDETETRRALALWAAGHHLLAGRVEAARSLLNEAHHHTGDRMLIDAGDGLEDVALSLASDFPLTDRDLAQIEWPRADPVELAEELVERFSPKWLMGWRDICRSTDERTLIASALPKMAVGHNFNMFFSYPSAALRLGLLANLNSFVLDFVARQKISGTHVTYFVIRQLPILPPRIFAASDPIFGNEPASAFIAARALELSYTADDLAPLARDVPTNRPPFVWDEGRRFDLRCELDAAFLHLYLPEDASGGWRAAPGETAEDAAALRGWFPTPRDAAAHILDQFPIVRRRDEKAFGTYRTKEHILEFHDMMRQARRAGRAYVSPLAPPPDARPHTEALTV